MNELVKAPAMALPMASEAVARDPESNTSAMVSSLRRHGVTATVKHKITFPTDPKTGETNGWREVISGCEIALTSSADHKAALAIIDQTMAPADEGDMEIWLAELTLVTARRNTSEAESELFLTAYTSRLAAYPGDIVRQTLKDWDGKWFPTWGELKDILEARVAPRRAIRTALCDLRPDGVKGAAPRPRKDLANYLNELENGCAPWRMTFKDRDEEREWIRLEILRVKAEMSEAQSDV
jgi:hypothetical protein